MYMHVFKFVYIYLCKCYAVHIFCIIVYVHVMIINRFSMQQQSLQCAEPVYYRVSNEMLAMANINKRGLGENTI